MITYIEKTYKLIKEEGIKYTLSRVPAFVKWRFLNLIYKHAWRITQKPLEKLLVGNGNEEYNQALQREYIAVLGRGPSLKNLHEFDFVNTFIIVNEFEMDDETVSSVLYNKDLIHFGNVTEPTLSFFNYYRYNVLNYQLNVSDQDWNKSPFQRNRGDRRRPEMYGFNPNYVPTEILTLYNENFSDEGTNTVGIHAVAFAATMSDADHIFTAGIDFLEPGAAGYLSSEEPSTEEMKERRNRSDDLKQDMTDIAKLFPNKDFHIITHSSYDPNVENIHTYQRGIEKP